MPNELALIRRIATLARADAMDVRVGIGDDAAVLDLPRGEQLVAAVDTLVAGVHFPTDTALESVGWKALAVNVSDFAAMGAQPRWALSSLTLPNPDSALEITRGLLACARRHGIALVGGDTTRGPLAICVTLLGGVPRQCAVTRAGARVDDEIWIAGTLGDAAAGLACVEQRLQASPRDRARLVRALDKPTPPLALGIGLRGVAHSMIDVSDGVLADLGHVLRASSLGAIIDPLLLPASAVMRRVVPDPVAREALQCGGDDYTLLFTASARSAPRVTSIARQCGVRVTRIGKMQKQAGLWRGANGARPARIATSGFDHFAAPVSAPISGEPPG